MLTTLGRMKDRFDVHLKNDGPGIGGAAAWRRGHAITEAIGGEAWSYEQWSKESLKEGLRMIVL